MRSGGTVEVNGTPLEGSPSTSGSEDTVSGMSHSTWLNLAIRAYNDGREYYRQEMQPRLRKALDHFNSKHATDSKFAHPNFPKQRSRIFRPKIRALLNKSLAHAANAFFATADVVQVDAANQGDKEQNEAAKFRRALLNHRLRTTIPWFKILGAMVLDAENTGVCVTRQWWRREERIDITLDDNGEPVESLAASIDGPQITPISIENICLHPQANWLDPFESSPYIIERENRHLDDVVTAVQKRREREDKVRQEAVMAGKPAPRYIYGVPYLPTINEDVLKRHCRGDVSDQSGERAARTAGRVDPEQASMSDQRFGTLQIWRCTYRYQGIDWYFETIGPNLLLSEPMPLGIVQHGFSERPYKMGSVWLQPHSAFPEGSNGLAKELTEELNENTNQTIDALRQQTNPRTLVRRGSAIDLRALLNNVAGGIVMTGDPQADVRPLQVKELGQSVYAERDRISVEMDDLTGNFGGSSVQTNQSLNKTVGGMNLLDTNANVMTEFKLRCLCETAVEPVLRQVDALIAKFETDESVIQIALTDSMTELDEKQQQELMTQFPPPEQPPPEEGQPPAPPAEDTQEQPRAEARKGMMKEKSLRLFRAAIKLVVDVGFGSTSPEKRVTRLTTGLTTLQAVAPQLMAEADTTEIGKEVMGSLGFANGARFFPIFAGNVNPEVAMLRKENEQLKQQIQMEEAKERAKMEGMIQVATIRAQNAMQIQQIRNTGVEGIERMRMQVKGIEFQHRKQMDEIDAKIKMATSDTDRQRLYLEREALSHSITESNRALDMQFAQINAQAQAVAGAQQAGLAERLLSPGSSEVQDPFPNNSAPTVGGGSDRAGVISRGQFGDIPGSGA